MQLLRDLLTNLITERKKVFMATEHFTTGNSQTAVEYNTDWLVIDVGSGHNPHPRANILVDRYLSDEHGLAGRSGRSLTLPQSQALVIADIGALPFVDKAADFIICSHVLEHISAIDGACSELNRVGRRGYIETPSKFAEILRHPPYHLWFVSSDQKSLKFEHVSPAHPLGAIGKLFFSLYFYQTPQLKGKDVFKFAHGANSPLHPLCLLIRRALRRFWTKYKSVTYMRLQWNGQFTWIVRNLPQ